MNTLPLLLAASLLAVGRADSAPTLAPHELWRRPAEPAEQPLGLENPELPVAKSLDPAVDEWLGTAIQVGTTRTELQHNGSLGRMLAVSSDGVVHGVFSGGINGTTGRRARTWCVEDGNVISAVDIITILSGYTTAATSGPDPANGLPQDTGIVAFYTTSPLQSWMGTDFAGCTQAFNTTGQPGQALIAPHVAVDANDRIHMVTTGSSAHAAPNCSFYLSSVNGITWDAVAPVQLTTDVRVHGAIPVANNHSQRAAVIYLQRTGPEDIAANETGELGGQLHQDLLVYVSDTGNLLGEIAGNEPLNLTSFGPSSPAPFGDYGCRAYANVDGLFAASLNQELHVAYSAAVMFDDTFRVYTDEGDSLVVAYYQYARDRGQIWHLDTEPQVWSLVAGTNTVLPGSSDLPEWMGQGFRCATDRPQIAQDPQTGFLYVIWSQHDRGDLSAAGYPNGEILARCSADNGATWGPAVNLSNTPSPGCPPGGCDAEDWASMAPQAVDGQLNLTFIHDRDAGVAAAEQGSETVNPVIHLQVAVGDIPPHDGTPWNAAGRVGLVHERRLFDWDCSAWEGENAILDQARIEEPVHILNESTFPVQVATIEFHHHPTDLLGSPGDLGLTELGLDVLVDGLWMPVEQWNHWLPAWKTTRFRARVGWSGLPSHDQVLVFRFDDREDLYYRIAWDAFEEPDCPGVQPLQWYPLEPTTSVNLSCGDTRPRAPGNLTCLVFGNRLRLEWDAVTERVCGRTVDAVEYAVMRVGLDGSQELLATTTATSIQLESEYGANRVRCYQVICRELSSQN